MGLGSGCGGVFFAMIDASDRPAPLPWLVFMIRESITNFETILENFPMTGFNCLKQCCLALSSKALMASMSLRNWVSKSCSRTACDAPSATIERDSGCFITAAYVARSLVGSLSVLQRFWNISGLNKDCPSSQSDTVSFWRPSTSKGCKFERTVIMPMHGVCPLKKQGQVKHFGGL